MGELNLTGANTFGGGDVERRHPGHQQCGRPGQLHHFDHQRAIDASTATTITNSYTQNWNSSFAFIGTANLSTGPGTVNMNGSTMVTLLSTANTLTVGGIIGDGGNGYSLTANGPGTLR